MPVTLHKEMLQAQQSLAGIAVPVTVSTSRGPQFRENLLFTHRGLSGPAILQISSYWQPGKHWRSICCRIAIWIMSWSSCAAVSLI